MPLLSEEARRADIAHVMYREACRIGAPSARKPALDEIERRPPDWARVEHERRMDRERRNPVTKP